MIRCHCHLSCWLYAKRVSIQFLLQIISAFVLHPSLPGFSEISFTDRHRFHLIIVAPSLIFCHADCIDEFMHRLTGPGGLSIQRMEVPSIRRTVETVAVSQGALTQRSARAVAYDQIRTRLKPPESVADVGDRGASECLKEGVGRLFRPRNQWSWRRSGLCRSPTVCFMGLAGRREPRYWRIVDQLTRSLNVGAKTY